MRSNSSRGTSPALVAARRQFQKWRRTKRGRERIPRALWTAAVKVAVKHGVNQTSRALGLNHSALQAEMEKRSKGAVANRHSGSGFVELPLSALSGAPECTIEVENDEGAKLRIHFKGSATANVLSVSRALWSDQR